MTLNEYIDSLPNNLCTLLGEKFSDETVDWATKSAKTFPFRNHFLQNDPKYGAILEYKGICSWVYDLKLSDLHEELVKWVFDYKKEKSTLLSQNLTKTKRGIYDSYVVKSCGGYKQYIKRLQSEIDAITCEGLHQTLQFYLHNEPKT